MRLWLNQLKPNKFSGWLNLVLTISGVITLFALAIAAFLKNKEQETVAIIAFWAFLATALLYTLDYIIYGRKEPEADVLENQLENERSYVRPNADSEK